MISSFFFAKCLCKLLHNVWISLQCTFYLSMCQVYRFVKIDRNNHNHQFFFRFLVRYFPKSKTVILVVFSNIYIFTSFCFTKRRFQFLEPSWTSNVLFVNEGIERPLSFKKLKSFAVAPATAKFAPSLKSTEKFVRTLWRDMV